MLQALTRRSRLKTIVYFIKFVIGIALIIYLVKTINEHQDIIPILQKVDEKWIFFAIIIMVPNILLQAWKWWILIRNVKSDLSFWSACGSTLGGMSLGILTPGRIGELGKGLFLDQVEKWQITGLALLDRVFNMAAIMIFGLIAYLYILKELYLASMFIYIPIALTILILFVFFIYFLLNPEILRAAYNRFEQLHRFKEQTKLFFSSLRTLKRRTVTQVLLISCLFQVVVGIQFYMLIVAFEPSLSFAEGLVGSFSTVLTKAVLPISIADLGIRETAADFFFGLFVNNRAAIFNGSIILFMINVLFPSILGIFMLPKLSFQKDLSGPRK
ncbi:MAG: flippase-like domain-containing protein [Calditrichaeota bacterium]|nr:flippase-like domain-containing protein [Calditrichota bacterium]